MFSFVYTAHDAIRRNRHANLFSSPGEGYIEKNYEAGKQLGGSQREVIGTCTYIYADEAKCDQHMETFMKCIKASGG